MSDAMMAPAGGMTAPSQRRGPDLDTKPHGSVGIIFIGLLVAGLGYAIQGLTHDISTAGAPPLATAAFLLLGPALLIALGFEFVNGLHDTANALNRALPERSTPAFVQGNQKVEQPFTGRAQGETVPVEPARGQVTAELQAKSFDKPAVFAALSSVAHDMGAQVSGPFSSNYWVPRASS